MGTYPSPDAPPARTLMAGDPLQLLSFSCGRSVSDNIGYKPTRMGNDVSPYA